MIVSQLTLASLRRWDPDQIGPYTLLGRLGTGAMGQVYLGRSTAGRLVAVKTLKIELAEEAGFRVRFAREVAAATSSPPRSSPPTRRPMCQVKSKPPRFARLIPEFGDGPVRIGTVSCQQPK
jgi:serine/threonine protein kinase